MRRKWTRGDAVTLLFTLMFVVAAMLHNSGGAQTEIPKLARPGFEAPALERVTLDGQTVQLQKLRGHTIFLNFWASWCPPCNQEMPDIVRLSQTYKDQVTFLGVNLTSGDQVEGARSFVEKYGVRFPTLLDQDGQAARTYQVFAVPTTFLIDPSGKVVTRRDGPMSAQQMKSMIDEGIEVK